MKSFCLILVIGVFGSMARADKIEENRCIEQIVPAVKRLNALLTANHYAPVEFESSQLSSAYRPDFSPRMTVLEFDASLASIRCIPSTGEILSIQTHINEDQGPALDHPSKPTWTKNEAIAMAKKYVAAVFGQFPSNAGPPKIHFDATMELPKYYEGQWHIRWPRVDKGGHIFSGDNIDLWMSETGGLKAVYYNYFSQYEEPKNPLISKDEALKASRPAAETLLNSQLTRSSGLSGLQLGKSEAVLWIVNPNHIFQWKSMNDADSPADTTAKLAWIVEYQTTSGQSAITNHLIDIWIDAQTKETIGGNFK
jgi:hypothetical protein